MYPWPNLGFIITKISHYSAFSKVLAMCVIMMEEFTGCT